MKALGWILLGALGAGPAAFAGGVDGGGGNTRPAHPVSEADVRKVLDEGRSMVIFLLNRYSWEGSGDRVSLLERLRAIDITLETKGPCRDEAGNEVDGSASQRKQTVCISLPRLVQKLNRESLRNQALALVAHEYSHLIGTTEAEAEELQEYVLESLLNRDATEMYRAAYAAKYFLDDWVPSVSETRGQLAKIGWLGIRDYAKRLHSNYSAKLNSAPDAYFNLNDTFSGGYVLIETMRLGLLSLTAGGLGGDEEGGHFMQSLDLIFRGKEEVDGRTMVLMLGGGMPGGEDEVDQRFAAVKVERTRDFATAERELEKVYQFLVKYRADLRLAMRPLVP